MEKQRNTINIGQKWSDFKREFTIEVGAIALAHFKEGFENGGGQTDDSIAGWQEVQRREQREDGKWKYSSRKKNRKTGRYSGRFTRADRTRGILIGSGSGRLKRSIRVVKRSWPVVELATVGNEVNRYADVHNDGGRAGRGKGFTMPKREFLGPSKKLEAKIKKAAEEKLRALFTRR
jgi:phage gpG-like protein